MNQPNSTPRFSIRTQLAPEPGDEADQLLDTIRIGRLTEEQFARLFPSGCLQDAMCHEGTDAEGTAQVYFADHVIESALEPDKDGSRPSHQVLFAMALMKREERLAPPMAELRARARALDINRMRPLALQYLLMTADGGWPAEDFICEDIALAAHHAGVVSADLLGPPSKTR